TPSGPSPPESPALGWRLRRRSLARVADGWPYAAGAPLPLWMGVCALLLFDFRQRRQRAADRIGRADDVDAAVHLQRARFDMGEQAAHDHQFGNEQAAFFGAFQSLALQQQGAIAVEQLEVEATVLFAVALPLRQSGAARFLPARRRRRFDHARRQSDRF